MHSSPEDSRCDSASSTAPCVRAFRAIEALFDLQMFLFGCDVRRPAGNLLMRYGFRRYRGDVADRGATRYCSVRQGIRLQLWGSVFLLADTSLGALALKRDRFQLLHSPNPCLQRNGIKLDQLGAFRPATLAGSIAPLFSRMTGWLGEYEVWIAEVSGDDYRHACLKEHLRRPRSGVSPAALIELWGLAARFDWSTFLTRYNASLIHC